MLRKILFCTLAFFCTACCVTDSKRMEWKKANGKLKILSTIAMIDDLVSEIGKDQVDCIPLIRGELDPHSYELVKGDDEKFSRADIIFYNGLGLEHGLSLRQNLEKNPKAVAVSDSILREDPFLLLKAEGQYDPHIWMDIALWMRAVDPIVEALCSKAPKLESVFRQRGRDLKEKMKEADRSAYEILQNIPPEKRYLVTSHDAFNYFARHYLSIAGEEDWKIRCEAPEGLAPEAQMSIVDIIKVISHLEKFKIGVLFPESNVSRDSLNKILNAGREKGITLRLCEEPLYGDSMGNAKGYLEMIRHNVEVISRELKKS